MALLKKICLFYCVLITFGSNAQLFTKEEQYSLDSLAEIINSPKTHDTILASTWMEVANYYYLRDPDTAIAVCLKAKEISERLNYHYGKSNAYGWLGYLYQQKGDIKNSLKYSLKSLELVRIKGTNDEESTLLNNIAFIYQENKEFDQALNLYRQALTIQLLDEDIEGAAISYNNIGLCQKEMGFVDSALFYYHKSLEGRKQAGDMKGLARSMINLASIYGEQGRDEEALDFIKQSIAIDEEMNNKHGITFDYFHLSGQLAKMGLKDQAIEACEHSLQTALELGFARETSISAKLLSRLYEEKGDGFKALEMYKLYIEMKDKIENDETRKLLAKQEAKYEYEKQKVLDDALHKNELEEKERAEERQRLISYAIGGGLILVIAFLFVIFRRLKVTRNQKLVIEDQKQEIVDSITYAQRIQNAILPPDNLIKENLPNSFVLYLPKDIVAGDFYWTEKFDETVLFAVADCTGHGVPGAMVSVVCHNALNRAIREHNLIDPSDILDKTREIVIEQFRRSAENVKDGMDIALCVLKGRKLKFSGANNSLMVIRDGEIIEYKADRQPIGNFENATSFTQYEIDLREGDQLYIYSDGFADQFGGEAGKKLKSGAFKELLRLNSSLSIEEQKLALLQEFDNWKQSYDQVDDVCLFGVAIK